jgi:anaerobic selenocysteine-containing dehydrogenase
MSKKISRRDFLKLASVGAGASAILTGCGPASRYVTREPYTQMPEYTYNGHSTYFATTCRECAAGCGLVVRTHQGRAIKVEGNKNHPISLGKTCARGQATLQGLYNPNRVRGPLQHTRGQALYDQDFQDLAANASWDDALPLVRDALGGNPSQIAFLLGTAPDHLFDLVSDLCRALGAPAPVRFGALSLFEARATLTAAAQNLFGQAALPFFDLAGADVTFSFGASFLETWLSPVAYTRGFSHMRRSVNKARGRLVHFEPRLSQTAAKADEWIPIQPGTEGLIALAIGRLVARKRGAALPPAFSGVSVEEAAAASGVSVETLDRLAELFAGGARPLAIPGGAALGHGAGLETAEAVLALNALAGNLGQPGGLHLSALSPLDEEHHRPASPRELAALVEKMRSGQVQTLFIHGVNPLFELPRAAGFEAALRNVPQVISFATFPDETAMQADLILPDHHGLESWGYQRVATGAAQPTLSGAQPVVSPYYDTRATADVLLGAAALAGGDLAAALPYKDEVEFMQSRLAGLVGATGGSFNAPEINTFTAYFQQHGGWWRNGSGLGVPGTADVLNTNISAGATPPPEGEEFFLHPFVSPVLAEGGANKPWLQEIADPTTTVMWNSWVEINPETAHELGIENDDLIKITSEAGELEAPVYLYPAIHPRVIAIPFGQGHSAYGQFAAGRGVNPLDLLGMQFNAAGDLAFADVKVRIEKTGRRRVLSRLESRIGVYGEGLEAH